MSWLRMRWMCLDERWMLGVSSGVVRFSLSSLPASNSSHLTLTPSLNSSPPDSSSSLRNADFHHVYTTGKEDQHTQ